MVLKKGLALMMTTTLAIGLLAGCNSDKKDSATPASSGDLKVIKIATQTPLSGGSATQGEAIKLGAQLQLEQQKEDFKKLGFDLQLVPYDDQADPKKGVSNAQQLAADSAVLGVVGHLNSGVAIPSSEVYDKNSLVMVSPTNTATKVTDRGLKSVNRICARDDFQGPAAAQFAVNTLKAKKIFIIDDKTAYGTGLVGEFETQVKKLNVAVAGHESITVGEKDFNGVLNKVVEQKPDLIFFGGVYAEAGILIKQAREKGLKIPILGGDGVDSATLVEIAGPAIKDVYYSSIAADPSKTDAGKKFIDAYKAKYNKEVEGYSAYGYDAAGVLLQGLKNAIKDAGNKLPTREQVRDDVRKISDYTGAVTKVSFDEKGDNKFSKVYIYKFDEAKYPGKQQEEISQ